MAQALKDVPLAEPEVPTGVVNVGGEWFFEEFAGKAGVSNLGADGTEAQVIPMPPSDEKKKILDLFKN
jgi:penicillin-binding protein 1A